MGWGSATGQTPGGLSPRIHNRGMHRGGRTSLLPGSLPREAGRRPSEAASHYEMQNEAPHRLTQQQKRPGTTVKVMNRKTFQLTAFILSVTAGLLAAQVSAEEPTTNLKTQQEKDSYAIG